MHDDYILNAVKIKGEFVYVKKGNSLLLCSVNFPLENSAQAPPGFFPVRPAQVKYRFIKEHGEYPVAKWVKFFQVSRSGYYAFESRRVYAEQETNTLREEIKSVFEKSNGTYGPDRVCGVLRRNGRTASYRKVSRHMSEMNLSSVHNNHRTRSLTNSKKARGDGYPNLMRGQTFTMPRQAVCSDITYLKTGEGWLYTCVVKDVVTGEILGESMSDNMRKELVIQTFLNAQARHSFPKDTIFHSDRGSQYTSKEFMSTLAQYGIRQSFSRVGMPGDNRYRKEVRTPAGRHFAKRNVLSLG